MPLPRDEVLSLLAGHPLDRLPAFSGLPSLTEDGLAAARVSYAAAHTDAANMAAAAASTYSTFGFESAVVPFDLCVEAEALGAQVDFQADAAGFVPPVVVQPLPLDDSASWPDAREFVRRGRLPLVAEALRQLAEGVGREVVVGAWIPGPFTSGWQVFGMEPWMVALGDSARIQRLLDRFTDYLIAIGNYYRAAGADYLTIHEMGGSPQVIGPRKFNQLLKPQLTRLVTALPPPVVLSVCGDTNAAVQDLAECGAAALNVDQRNDLARTRQLLGPRPLLFGNIDPVGVLSQGTEEAVVAAVRAAATAGADALWPGCDLWPQIPAGNLRAFMQTARAVRRPRNRPSS